MSMWEKTSLSVHTSNFSSSLDSLPSLMRSMLEQKPLLDCPCVKKVETATYARK